MEPVSATVAGLSFGAIALYSLATGVSVGAGVSAALYAMNKFFGNDNAPEPVPPSIQPSEGDTVYDDGIQELMRSIVPENNDGIDHQLISERRARCPYCGGRGKYQEMGEETCSSCAGTGRDTKSDLWSEPCRKCNGSGRTQYCRWRTCKECNGSGCAA